ncbi:MAG: ABC transporter permease [Actinobacteria bacterium]|nr:ABC transporter permease [Actinomycetota bacterium]
MARFIARRVVQLILVLLSVTFVAFGALNFLGDPLVNIVGPLAAIDYCDEVEAGLREDSYTSINNAKGDCEIIGEAKADFGLDQPVVQRYFTWLGNIITGDLGTSFQTQLPVSEIIAQKLPKSLMLMVMAQVIALAVAIPVGVYSAYRAGRAVDRFALRNQWLPASFDDTSFGTRIHSLILPATVLGLGIAATYQRLLRTDLLTTLQEDFVHMARAKGMTDRHIMTRHALRPSLFSLITVFGVSTGALIGGSLVVEGIFSIPGIGSEIVTAVIRDDFPVVLGSVVVIATGFVVINFFVDLLYTWLDPRVRAS